MKKSEMQMKFKRALEELYEKMQIFKGVGDQEGAELIAWSIGGAAVLARQLGIITWDEQKYISDEAEAAAKGTIGQDEAC